MNLIRTSLALATALVMLPATAAQFDFHKLKSPTQPGDFNATNGVACTGGDRCSSNVDGGFFGGNLHYVNGGIALDASASFNGRVASVVQDHENGWSATRGAGLGVYHLRNDNGDDNITAGEMLTISFDQVVHLTRINLRSEGHNFTSWGNGKTFLFNGSSLGLPQNVGFINLNLTGQVFTFAFGGSNADQFYLSGMTAAAVPEPGTYALLAAGLGALGFVARRRREA